MDETERAYHMYRFPNVEITPVGNEGEKLEHKRKNRSMLCYVHKRGAALGLNGHRPDEPVALEEVTTTGRAMNAKDQRKVQQAAMLKLGEKCNAQSVEEFAQQNIDDASLRNQRIALLAQHAQQFNPQHIEAEHVA